MAASSSRAGIDRDAWPDLPLKSWQDTCATLHMWTQVIGKIRLALAPPLNHWWQVPLYVTSRGLTTSPIPYGTRTFQIDFDFLVHELHIDTSSGQRRVLALEPRPVADFYRQTMVALRSLDIEVDIWTTPVEVANPIPFEHDDRHAYDAEYAQRFWRILVQAERVLMQFRSGFIGKASPVHFFWGSFDLAMSFFSGRVAPMHPGVPNAADFVTREAYSHEVSSCGFWPGGGTLDAVFYAYAYPEPPGFNGHPVRPAAAAYHREMGEFFLPYEAVRTAGSPDQALLEFVRSTYDGAANLGKWDRQNLERQSRI